ncbi:MAG: DUF177 domain-containing protein [Rhizobiales bacterium]|nr:YceD family protein [Hyphomicrobiales bacterium]NRB12812.1 DUF177 domain-containing protein [Hyphomicrobiales bacterium]
MNQYDVKNMRQIFTVEKLPRAGFQLNLEATPDEREQLATQLNVSAVASFSANITIKQWRRGGVEIVGTFRTKLTQICVISLEPFVTELQEKIEQKFFGSTKIPELNDKKEGEMLDNDLDPPDALVDGQLNIFDYLSETLLLQLDPYPKKPDSRLESLAMGDKFEINQPTVETADDAASLASTGAENSAGDAAVKPKKVASHKPFADLAKLLKDK